MNTNGKIQLYIVPRIAAWLILGIFIGYWSFGLMPAWMWWTAMSLVVVAACFVKHPIANSVLLMVGVMCLGGVLVNMRLSRLNRFFPLHDQVYHAVIASQPVERGKILRCELLVLGEEDVYRVQAAILRDTITGRYRHISVGDGIEFRSHMKPFPSSGNGDSNFNYYSWLHTQGVVGQTFINYLSWRKLPLDISSLSLLQRVRLSMLRFRERLVGQLKDSGMEGQQQAIVAAMALGDKSALSKSTREAFSITGASHVLALSGLHMGIIYFLGTFLIRRRKWNTPFQIVSLAAIWAYAILVGLSPSVVRSATMLTVYGLLSIVHRTQRPLNALAIAAVIMLVCNPLMLWDVGFQMSFMAILGIFVFYRPLFGLFGQLHNPLVRLIWGMACVSVSAQMGVFPLIMYYFGRFSCYFFLTNFVAIPAVYVVLCCALAFFLFSFIPVVRTFLAFVLQTVVGWLLAALEWFSSFPMASIENIHITPLQVLMIYGLVGCLYGIVYYLHKGYVQAGLRRNR